MDGGVPETHVLAIASHVTSGYVGNTMATFCMQSLGCEVSAIHTVNYSNHVGYRRVKGRKSTPEEVSELYEGLKDSGLNHFDLLLSGYCPSAAVVKQVGIIARERKLQASTKPGSFFWALDPVMGDNGKMYVAEETAPMYKSLLRDADLILPNEFEAEVLSEVKIHDMSSLRHAITTLHEQHRIPHVLITSIQLPPTRASTPMPSQTTENTTSMSASKLSIVGSTATSDQRPRLFRITVPALPVYFSGTGDMFAALLVARLREAAAEADLLDQASWRSPDDVAASDLPLAKAAQKVLASMHAVLIDTAQHYNAAKAKLEEETPEREEAQGDDADRQLQRHLRLTRAAEVRVVRNVEVLRHPPDMGRFQAVTLAIEDS